MNASDFVVGCEVKFMYNQKIREGQIEKVGNTYIVLKYSEGGMDKYKSFRFDRMTLVTFYGNVAA